MHGSVSVFTCTDHSYISLLTGITPVETAQHSLLELILQLKRIKMQSTTSIFNMPFALGTFFSFKMHRLLLDPHFPPAFEAPPRSNEADS